jgi:photosystem II stability/assembly factor-like uncharacterized protein
MKKIITVLLIILVLFKLFYPVSRIEVVKSDSGQWIKISNKLISNKLVSCIAIDPKNTNIIYAGTCNSIGTSVDGVFKSTNGGVDWTLISKGLPKLDKLHLNFLAIDPVNTQIIYLVIDCGMEVSGSGIYKSTDGGSNWNKIDKRFTRTCGLETLVVDPINTQTIYVGTENGVYKSTDGGTNWNIINNGMMNTFVLSLAIDPKNTQTIYAGLAVSGGIYKSMDSGESWTKINIDTGFVPSIVKSIAIDPTNTDIIYATTYRGVYKSIDGGINWSPTGLTSNGEFIVNYIAIDPTNTQVIYAGAYESGGKEVGGVYKSTDSGNSWSSIGLTGYTVQSIVIDSKNTSTIYVVADAVSFSLNDNGIFKLASKMTIVLQIGKSTFLVNGISKTLDSPPVIKNSRTLLPIRAIIESLGGSVTWDATARKVTITLGSNTIELWIGKNTAKVNGVNTLIDSTNSKVVPEIINSRTMLPLRFVTENLGCDVQWNGTTQTIIITYGG